MGWEPSSLEQDVERTVVVSVYRMHLGRMFEPAVRACCKSEVAILCKLPTELLLGVKSEGSEQAAGALRWQKLGSLGSAIEKEQSD
eukprot:XP_001705726.1 Hypothetical protein GL50803_86618 [Giardia lamblia ATCC 50803]